METWQPNFKSPMEEGLSELDCGDDGWLCDMCKRDAASENVYRLVEAIALAGAMANNENLEVTLPEIATQVRIALQLLREREGGEES